MSIFVANIDMKIDLANLDTLDRIRQGEIKWIYPAPTVTVSKFFLVFSSLKIDSNQCRHIFVTNKVGR